MKKSLYELVGQYIELTVRYHPVGHFRVAGRVRFVSNGETFWVGDACFDRETVVRVSIDDDDISYIVELDCYTESVERAEAAA